MKATISGILLAAGSGSRFGGNKLLHRMTDGRPLVLAAAQTLRSVLSDCIAVVRDRDDEVARLLAAAGFELVVNRRAAAGMGSSIACAVRQRRGSRAWLIALADMPWLQADTVAGVVAALEAGAAVAAPVYRQRRGHPVGFAARYYTALSRLNSDRGARDLVTGGAAVVTGVEVDDPGVLADVDTPDDLDFLAG